MKFISLKKLQFQLQFERCLPIFKQHGPLSIQPSAQLEKLVVLLEKLVSILTPTEPYSTLRSDTRIKKTYCSSEVQFDFLFPKPLTFSYAPHSI